jgi:hypothetical protein
MLLKRELSLFIAKERALSFQIADESPVIRAAISQFGVECFDKRESSKRELSFAAINNTKNCVSDIIIFPQLMSLYRVV